jgi:hypothetical protein
MAAAIELTQPIDPRQRISPSAVRVSLLPDSTPVRVASVLPRPVDDSLHAKRPAAPDTAAADTTPPARRPAAPGARPRGRAAAPEKLTARPPLTEQLVLRPAQPWRPGARYTVEIRGIRNVTGVTGDVVGTLIVPERPPRDSISAPGDAPAAGADTARAARDSVPAKPAPTKPAPTKPAPTKPAPTKPR